MLLSMIYTMKGNRFLQKKMQGRKIMDDKLLIKRGAEEQTE